MEGKEEGGRNKKEEDDKEREEEETEKGKKDKEAKESFAEGKMNLGAFTTSSAELNK